MPWRNGCHAGCTLGLPTRVTFSKPFFFQQRHTSALCTWPLHAPAAVLQEALAPHPCRNLTFPGKVLLPMKLFLPIKDTQHNKGHAEWSPRRRRPRLLCSRWEILQCSKSRAPGLRQRAGRSSRRIRRDDQVNPHFCRSASIFPL